ncbi:MAG: ribonuclease HIII [Mycoplasmoidaceae bacterium]|nr:ribonuclease HIII [Mycoplasmoidaceae bacterium]
MQSLTSKINKTEFRRIDTLYKVFKQKDLKNDNLLAFYKTKDLAISVFKNGTLLLQGEEAAILNFGKKVATTPVKKSLNKDIDGMVGMDEVGTGDYFGPIVTCACYVPNVCIDKIKSLKVNDSKKLEDSYIKKIAKDLKKLVIAEVCVCQPLVYNKIIDKFDNSNVVKAICHNDSLTKLTMKLKAQHYKVVLDQFVARNNYYKYLEQAKSKPAYIDIIEMKAESKYLSVACASVIARDAFLTYMDKLSAKAGVKLPRGSVEKSKIIAVGKQIIKKEKLVNFAKLHFDSITGEILNK